MPGNIRQQLVLEAAELLHHREAKVRRAAEALVALMPLYNAVSAELLTDDVLKSSPAQRMSINSSTREKLEKLYRMKVAAYEKAKEKLR